MCHKTANAPLRHRRSTRHLCSFFPSTASVPGCKHQPQHLPALPGHTRNKSPPSRPATPPPSTSAAPPNCCKKASRQLSLKQGSSQQNNCQFAICHWPEVHVYVSADRSRQSVPGFVMAVMDSSSANLQTAQSPNRWNTTPVHAQSPAQLNEHQE